MRTKDACERALDCAVCVQQPDDGRSYTAFTKLPLPPACKKIASTFSLTTGQPAEGERTSGAVELPVSWKIAQALEISE
jgi:hypothetical protein